MQSVQPRWYKDAIIYELHVRAFYDSVGDGTGEFRGLAQKLDYLQDLGITAIWLLPFYPSPLRDDGYDIADYTSIHPDYGNLEGFQEFLQAAHARGLRVITELVINHTSDQHPWFQRARRSPAGSTERDFYVWSDSPEKYPQARIIFKDFETSNWAWDKVARAYYWHRFYAHQPDLNFDNPDVWKAIFPVLDFWFDMGVDGLRLDAVPYLFEREGTNCENLPETHGFLKALRKHVDERYPDRMLLAEANQWPEDAVAYFGDGDECHMAFHFPVMPRLFMAMHMEDRLPIVDIMEQTPTLPENCQWALFLRNHDELTLEMVTDEERDYMYRAYASDPRARINLGIRHRLAPLLGNNRRRIELMNGLLFSLPGTPVLYYGDEIGMGDNIFLGDRNGVRTPMQWSADRNAGFSRANPQRLYLPIIIDPEYHYESINVEAQQNNQNSLLWWNKRLIGLRRRYLAFSRGRLEFLRPLNRHILAFLRIYEEETVLVVANLSRFVQHAELDLSAYEGLTPVELLGGSPMPLIGKAGYPVMLGPHSFYWFSLTKRAEPSIPGERDLEFISTVQLTHDWEHLPTDPALDNLEEPLTQYVAELQLVKQSGRTLRKARIRELIPLPAADQTLYVVLLELEIQGASLETTWLPLEFIPSEKLGERRSGAIAKLSGKTAGWLFDAFHGESANHAITEFLFRERRVRGSQQTELVGVINKTRGVNADEIVSLPIRPITSGRSVVSLTLGDKFVVKPLPRLEVASLPELDLGRWLSESRQFQHSAPWLGSLEFRWRRDQPMTLAEVFAFIPNEGDCWQFTLDELSIFFDRVVAFPEELHQTPVWNESFIHAPEQNLTPAIAEAFGGYLQSLRIMATLLADLHKETSSESRNAAFIPEEFSTQYQRSLYQSFRNHASQVFHEAKRMNVTVGANGAPLDWLLQQETVLFERYHRLLNRRLNAWRIRIHGNCHLGQLLRSGINYLFVDFEGGAQSVGERRIKRSAMRDVAGMIHSLNYAAFSALLGTSSRRGRAVGLVREEDFEYLSNWARFWRKIAVQIFLSTYRQNIQDHPFLSLSKDDFDLLLDVFVLDTSVAELRRNLWESTEDTTAALHTLRAILEHESE